MPSRRVGLLAVVVIVQTGLGASSSAATTSSASGLHPRLQATFAASDDNRFFGWSSAISGDTAVVGAIGGNGQAGGAYVFIRSGQTWSQQATFQASDGAPGDFFGLSVAIAGDTAVVGAIGHDAGAGAAYVFGRVGDTWSQQAELAAADGASGDYFGRSVSISGSTVLVGADGNDSGTGAAYVFVHSGDTWSQQAKLTASDGVAGDSFGASVGLSRSTAVIGTNSGGGAYVFVRSGDAWSQQAELTVSDDVYFGSPVAVSGSTVLAAASDTRTLVGSVYVFTRSGQIWSQQAKLTGPGGPYGNCFGCSVALDRSTAVVGSPSRAAFVFARSGDAWAPRGQFMNPDHPSLYGYFGFSVAISGSTVIVGATGTNNSLGSADAYVTGR